MLYEKGETRKQTSTTFRRKLYYAQALKLFYSLEARLSQSVRNPNCLYSVLYVYVKATYQINGLIEIIKSNVIFHTFHVPPNDVTNKDDIE